MELSYTLTQPTHGSNSVHAAMKTGWRRLTEVQSDQQNEEGRGIGVTLNVARLFVPDAVV